MTTTHKIITVQEGAETVEKCETTITENVTHKEYASKAQLEAIKETLAGKLAEIENRLKLFSEEPDAPD